MNPVHWLSIIPIIITILVVHEMGHYLTAKLFGIKTLEFGIGFPPRLAAFATGNTAVATSAHTRYVLDGQPVAGPPAAFRKGALARITSVETEQGTLQARQVAIHTRGAGRKKAPPPLEAEAGAGPTVVHQGRIREVSSTGFRIADMEWSLNLVPAGAFVNLYEDPTRRSRSALNARPAWQKTIVIAAGIVANLAFPVIPISAATALHSGHSYIQVAGVEPGSPAQAAGISPGDVITAAGRIRRPTVADLQRLASSQEKVALRLQSPGRPERTIAVRPAATAPDGSRRLGIHATAARAGPPPARAMRGLPDRAGNNTATLYREFYNETASWFTGAKKPELTGPVGLVYQTAGVVENSRAVGYLIVTAVLSVNVGLVNVLPVVPMDGGRLAVIAFESVRRGRPISRQAETKLVGMGLVLIGIVTVWLAVADVSRLMGN